jgi:hypothetical protein
MRYIAIFALAGLAICSIDPPLLGSTTELYFTSSPTSWVGKGQSRDITPSSGYIFAAETTDEYIPGGNKSGLLFHIVSTPNSDTDYWELDLLGAGFTRPVVGFYPNALRFLVQTNNPGLDFAGNHAGDNTLTGQFQVLEATFDSNGLPTVYAVNFTQYDEGATSAWIQGYFRYNSTIPVPEPSTAALLTIGIFAFLNAHSRSRRQQ